MSAVERTITQMAEMRTSGWSGAGAVVLPPTVWVCKCCLELTLWPWLQGYIPDKVRRQLVEMVAEGCAVATGASMASGGRLARLCMRKLSVISGRGAAHGQDRGALPE